ncbi:EpsG family protein [Peribacillus frigoritolerans]|uniref:EpsG family protein n=1 Tax=Peribacillus frigoritolerans TaxID=450367 RepID=UPI003DA01CC5
MGVYYITALITYITAWLAQHVRFRHFEINSLLKNKKKTNKFFVFLTTTVLVCVAGLRWGVGTDYWQYSLNYYKYIETDNLWQSIIDYDEPGIYLLAKVSSWIHNDYSSMFFVISGVTIILFIITISKHSNMFAFSILLFLFIGSWHGSFNGLRQYLACAVLFAGHRYIIERKLLKYTFVVLLASAFHTTALVMFALYFVPIKKIGLKQITFLIVVSVTLLYSYNFVMTFVERLLGNPISSDPYITNEVNFLRVAVTFAPLLLYTFLTVKNKLKNEDMFYINILFVNAALMFATSGSAYLARIGIYTNIYATLSYPRLLQFQDKKLELIIKFIIVIFYAFYWNLAISGSDNLSNFQWIFNR